MEEDKKLFVYTLKLKTTNKHVEQLNRRFKMAQWLKTSLKRA